MKKISLALAFFATSIIGANAQVLISQYYEGSSGANRLLEIWNPTASVINFATTNLIINLYTNGSAAVSNTYTLNTGSLAAGGVLVIANTDAAGDSAIASAGLTVIDTTSAAFNFNGDDAIELRLGTTTTDIIGQIGTDPGSAWAGSGVSTVDQNIQLISSALSTGDTDGSNSYDPSVRYSNVAAANVTAGSLAGFGVAPVPEPAAAGMIVGGVSMTLALFRRRRGVV